MCSIRVSNYLAQRAPQALDTLEHQRNDLAAAIMALGNCSFTPNNSATQHSKQLWLQCLQYGFQGVFVVHCSLSDYIQTLYCYGPIFGI